MPDPVQRDLSVDHPGLRTCGDITYIPTGVHAVSGSQYMSREFRELCESLGVVQSIGRTG